jgi:hypothetical protein
MGLIVNAELDGLLTDLIAGTLLAGPVDVHLFSNNVVFGSGTTLGGLTEAAYLGYAPVTCLPFAAPSGGSGGTSLSAGTAAVFAPGVLGSPEDCYGWYVTDSAGNLVGGDNFPVVPINMGGTTTSLTITPSLALA